MTERKLDLNNINLLNKKSWKRRKYTKLSWPYVPPVKVGSTRGKAGFALPARVKKS
jgi:hypothetical protein